MTSRIAIGLSLLILAGCASVSRTSVTPPSPAASDRSSTYQPIEGRGPEVVAELRAAPAPSEPTVSEGTNFDADERQLAAQGFMPIGTSRFTVGDADARRDALHQAREVGADRVIIYPPAAAANGADSGETRVAYFVRFKLPFGATFRDLNATERQTLNRSGVRIGSVVNDTPASKANLLTGDVVVSINGKPIGNRGEFQAALRENMGRAVTLGIVRNGETLDRMVKLGLVPTVGAVSR